MEKLGIIIVTHNSDVPLDFNIHSIMSNQISYEQMVIIDSGSKNTNYLNKYKRMPRVEVVCEENVGFAKANNIGYSMLEGDINRVLFLNPDIIFLGDIIRILYACINDRTIAVSPILKRYVLDNNDAVFTDEIDSAGICSTFYGKFYDSRNINDRKKLRALCGAFILCDKGKLDILFRNGKIFNENIFMYKEDIELGLRIRKAGYEISVCSECVAYHGRGWKDRKTVSLWQRKMSAKNDWYLLPYLEGKEKYMARIYFFLKQFYVNYLEGLVHL